MNRAEALSQRMLFVRDAAGTPVASASLWFGSPFGAEIDRIHWVATDEAHQRRGLCVKRVSQHLFHTLGNAGLI